MTGTTAAQQPTPVSSSGPARPRLVLVASRAGQAVLDGGWWPRSRDPAAELPGFLLALAARFGPVRKVMLNADAWDNHSRRLTVGAGEVRMGWFTSLDPALVTATTDGGDQLDLLVVPPGTARAAADQAMSTAADPTNTVRAPDLVAAMATGADKGGRTAGSGGRPERG
jgi:hypothetical protein